MSGSETTPFSQEADNKRKSDVNWPVRQMSDVGEQAVVNVCPREEELGHDEATDEGPTDTDDASSRTTPLIRMMLPPKSGNNDVMGYCPMLSVELTYGHACYAPPMSSAIQHGAAEQRVIAECLMPLLPHARSARYRVPYTASAFAPS